MATRKRKLTKEKKQYLIDLKKEPNEVDIRFKEIIKQPFYNNFNFEKLKIKKLKMMSTLEKILDLSI